MNRNIENMVLIVCTSWSYVQAEAEGVAKVEEEEPLLGLLDYVLLLAIAGIGYWWFFMRDSDSDKIPEVCFNR